MTWKKEHCNLQDPLSVFAGIYRRQLFVEKLIGKQLIRAATSVGANYIEANEALGKKDFLMRIRICRKEAKECGYWLKLVEVNHPDLGKEREILLEEL